MTSTTKKDGLPRSAHCVRCGHALALLTNHPREDGVARLCYGCHLVVEVAERPVLPDVAINASRLRSPTEPSAAAADTDRRTGASRGKIECLVCKTHTEVDARESPRSAAERRGWSIVQLEVGLGGGRKVQQIGPVCPSCLARLKRLAPPGASRLEAWP